jgi:hypothetical protein
MGRHDPCAAFMAADTLVFKVRKGRQHRQRRPPRAGPNDVLAFTAFPRVISRQIWSNNPNGHTAYTTPAVRSADAGVEPAVPVADAPVHRSG